MRDLKWTRKTTRKVARQLRRLDIRVSANTVGRLLKAMGFSLRGNHKNLEHKWDIRAIMHYKRIIARMSPFSSRCAGVCPKTGENGFERMDLRC